MEAAIILARKAACPAGNATCRVCGKLGHFIVDAIMASAQLAGLPQSQILVSQVTSDPQHRVTAVADTGAQVCVAEPALMNTLDPTPKHLSSRADLRDLANVHLPTLGASSCSISIPGRSTVQDIYFVRSVNQIYLSSPPAGILAWCTRIFPALHPQ